MELYLKKYFWVVSVVVWMLCGILTAKGLNHLIEGKYLVGDAKKRSAPKMTAPRRTPEKSKIINKDPQVVISHNMFCSTCVPVPAEVAAPAPAENAPSGPQPTSLPLQLLATSVAKQEI